MFNFTSNAIKFSSEGASIEIGVKLPKATEDVKPAAPGNSNNRERAGSQIEFFVRDHGVGISEQDMQNLFQPFFQVRPGDLQKGRGSGLGLCICKRIIHLMGGSIGVRSLLGAGSTFFVSVPLEEASEAQATQLQAAKEPAPAKSLSLSPTKLAPPRVLVTDDVLSNRKVNFNPNPQPQP